MYIHSIKMAYNAVSDNVDHFPYPGKTKSGACDYSRFCEQKEGSTSRGNLNMSSAIYELHCKT